MLILSELRDFDWALYKVERFLPYIDNWATCDQLIVKAFARTPQRLLAPIEKWLRSGETYTVRYAIGLLMRHFLDERFSEEYLKRVAAIRSEEYYINMMSARYFATALAKQREAVLPYFAERRLPIWVHNKAIQKARESRRVPSEVKQQLRGMMRKE